MNFDQWWDEYQPKVNLINPHASGPDVTSSEDTTPHVFNLQEKELAHVQSVFLKEPGSVWTLLEVDGNQIIVNGLHRVNREGFYVTEKSFTGAFIEIHVGDGEVDDDYESDGEHDEDGFDLELDLDASGSLTLNKHKGLSK